MIEKKQCGKLPKSFKKKWVDALRSGKYKKTRGTLYERGAYCVLGVAGAVAGYETGALRGGGDLQWTDSRVPEVLKGKIARDLIELNDSGRPDEKSGTYRIMGFKRLADYIEKNL